MPGKDRRLGRRKGGSQDGPLGGRAEMRNIRTGLQIDAELGFAAGLHVVLGQAATHLARNAAYHVVGVGVVVQGFGKDVDANAALLELVGSALEGAFDDMPQKTGIAPAVAEDRTGENAVYLLANRAAIQFLIRAVSAAMPVTPLENRLSQSRTCHERPPFNWVTVYH